jgi:hypothetical protein
MQSQCRHSPPAVATAKAVAKRKTRAMSDRDTLAARAMVRLMPQWAIEFNFDIVQRAYDIADAQLQQEKELEHETV